MNLVAGRQSWGKAISGDAVADICRVKAEAISRKKKLEGGGYIQGSTSNPSSPKKGDITANTAKQLDALQDLSMKLKGGHPLTKTGNTNQNIVAPSSPRSQQHQMITAPVETFKKMGP